MMTCRHCQQRPALRARGLCNQCYKQPSVRALYPISTSKFARRGIEDRCVNKPALFATQSVPGSPAKLAILKVRVAGHQDTVHPNDNVDVHGQVDGMIRLLEDLRLIDCPRIYKPAA